jgi:uncharacterized membrane protein
MAEHTHTIEVERPVTDVYNAWTQFEAFPRFMEGVREVRQIDNTMTHWTVEIAGQTREFDAQIVEQRPDQVIAWRSLEEPRQAGRVSFTPVARDRTAITLQMEFEPEGIVENTGEALGMVDRRVRGDLENFAEFMSTMGAAEGGWRGEVHGGVEDSGGGMSGRI